MYKIILLLLINVSLLADSYITEDIKMPLSINPEVGGLGFTKEGTLVVAMRRYGILMAEPTKDPKTFKWEVFSSDILHNMCGLQVISKNELIVSQMPELTRIKDTDKDGKADLYETIAPINMSGNYHETNTITPAPQGGWYVAIGTASYNGPTFTHTRGEFSLYGRKGRNFSAVPWKGWVLHVAEDGTKTPFAKGFRANNGIGMNLQKELFVTDNQGDWRGTSPVYHVEKNKFYGHPSSLVWDKKFVKKISKDPLFYYLKDMKKYNKDRTYAAILLPHGFMCNSPSEIIFDNKGNFGPFKGNAFVGDVAGARILRLMFEKVNGVIQGSCIYFMDDKLRAGNNRLVFNPKGDTLYTGQTVRGWGNPSEGLQRIVFNGKMPFDIKNMSLLKDGFKITFTKPLKEINTNLFTFTRYAYPSTHKYGSKEYKKAKLKILNTELSDDKKEVIIKLSKNDLIKKNIFELNIDKSLVSQDNTPLRYRKLCYTLNQTR